MKHQAMILRLPPRMRECPIIYRTAVGRRLAYWVYLGGQRCHVDETLALNWARSGQARIKTIEGRNR